MRLVIARGLVGAHDVSGAHNAQQVLALLPHWSRTPPEGDFAPAKDWIDACYGADGMEEILTRQLTELQPCLELEFTVARTALRRPDFVEGVRAAVVDKDRAPRWSPSRLEDVPPAEVDLYFVPVNDQRLFSE